MTGAAIRRIVDPLAFCPDCGHDTNTATTTAEQGITFTKTGEQARVGICRSCRIMWTERTPQGQEMRAEIGGGKRRTTISLPGQPTRTRHNERLEPIADQRGPSGPGLPAHAGRPDGPTDADRTELRHYETCRVGSCGECQRIEQVWNTRWRRGLPTH